MELNDSILKDFADAVNSNGLEQVSDSQHLYATVVSAIEGDLVYVRINGSEIDTPARSLVKVGAGDVVMCAMRGHTLTIIGNISYPALTRIENVYMTLTADGLMIGRLDSQNKPYESYIVVGPSSSNIYNIDSVTGIGVLVASFGETVQVGKTTTSHVITTNSGVEIRNGSNKILADFTAKGITLRDSTGTTIASFTNSSIEIGKSSTATVSFCDGKATISLDGSTLKMSGGNNVNAIGISNSYGNYKSEVVCEAKSGSHRAAMQVLNGSSTVASLVLSDTGVNVFTGQHLTENGIEVVKVNDIIATGATIWNVTPGEAYHVKCTATANVPDGFTLISVRGAKTNDPLNWDVSQIEAGITGQKALRVDIFTKDGTDRQKPGQVICSWVAIRTSGAKVIPNQTIDW